jgi:hypothetical protein
MEQNSLLQVISLPQQHHQSRLKHQRQQYHLLQVLFLLQQTMALDATQSSATSNRPAAPTLPMQKASAARQTTPGMHQRLRFALDAATEWHQVVHQQFESSMHPFHQQSSPLSWVMLLLLEKILEMEQK